MTLLFRLRTLHDAPRHSSIPDILCPFATIPSHNYLMLSLPIRVHAIFFLYPYLYRNRNSSAFSTYYSLALAESAANFHPG